MAHIIGLIIVGLLVGALGRLFHPGRDPMGLLATLAIGLVSVVLAGLLVGGFIGFIVAILIGVGLVGLYSSQRQPRTLPWRRRGALRL